MGGNYLDLFSGIGGFALGLYWAGWRFDEHYFSEVDPYCVELYQKRFPDAIPLGDIKEIDCAKLPEGEWVITGGFPCQDISCAGKGEGIQASRSGLWFEMWRVIRELRPRWVVAENVGAITNRGLGAVINSLAKIGYDCEWQDIRASDMGAPHKRERIWIVAYPSSTREWTKNSRIQSEKQTLYIKNGKRFRNGFNTSSQNVANTGLQRPQEYEEQTARLEQCSQDVADTEYLWELQSQGCKQNERRWISDKSWWAVEPDVGCLVDGLPDGLGRFEGRVSAKSHKRVDQLKGLGNSVIPQIPELLFRRIKYLQEQM